MTRFTRHLFLVAVLASFSAKAQNDIIVYMDSLRQTVTGFGAANIVPWRPDMPAGTVQKAFGTGAGQIGFSILRLRVPFQSNEFALNVPTAQAAYALGAKIIASPWTPPAWMKTNDNIVGGSVYDTSYASYAAHLKSFYDYMVSYGVPLYAISVQNEPDITVTYESCDWNASQMLKFVKENAQSIGTKIIAPESFNFNHTISDAILNDSVAASHLAIVGGHIYGSGLTTYPLPASKGKEYWMTEHLDTDTSWTAVLATGKEIGDCLTAGMNAYIWWYIVRFYGPISEDGTVSKRGYVMSQFARFIRPGYQRVLMSLPRGSVTVSGYKKPAVGNSQFVIVAVNSGAGATQQTFRLAGVPIGTSTIKTYVTSAVKNCEPGDDIVVADTSFTANLEASSVTTFVGNIVTGVDDPQEVPRMFELEQNFPNPFNPTTAICFTLPESGRVSLRVFDVLGREVMILMNGELASGYHQTEWNAEGAASGMYFFRLEFERGGTSASRFVETRKMLLIR